MLMCGNSDVAWTMPTCHCGLPAKWHAANDAQGNPGVWTRGLCADCDAVRCDAYPGECESC